MHRKMMSPLTVLRLFLLFLSQFAECSVYVQQKAMPSSPSNNINNHQGQYSGKTFDIVLHGILLWVSMGLLMPAGILIIRTSSTIKDCSQTSRKILFYLHAIFQGLSVLLVTVGAVLSIRKFENEFDNNHQRIGLALYGTVFLQVLTGFKRPERGSKGRSAWYLTHWILGTTVSLVGILNIYTGLQAYHNKTSKSTTLWTIIFTAQLSFMSIFYLFQDKWEYMQKQWTAVIRPDGASAPADHHQLVDISQKEAATEPRRKSNALNRLFQVT